MFLHFDIKLKESDNDKINSTSNINTENYFYSSIGIISNVIDNEYLYIKEVTQILKTLIDIII